MATLGITVKSDFDQASKDLKEFKATSESTAKSLKKFQDSFKGEQVDKFLDKQRLSKIALSSTRGSLAATEAEFKSLGREIERLIKRGINPQDASVKKLTRRYDELGKELNQAASLQKKFTNQTKKSSSELLSTFVAIGAGIAGVSASLKQGFDLSKEYAKFRQASEATAAQFGVNADFILQKLGEVSDGTISNNDLIESANRALALNVTDDIGKIADLLEVARVRGRALGVDTNVAFNDLVTGIGRGSALILDNLGIVTKGWNEEAKAAGVAFDTQFILNKVLADGADILKRTGDLTLTQAEKYARFEASLKNIRLELGERLADLFTKPIEQITEFLNNAKAIAVTFAILKTVVTAVTDQILIPINILINGAKTAAKAILLIKESFDALKEGKKAIEVVRSGIDQLKALTIDYGKNTANILTEGVQGVVNEWKKAYKVLTEETEKVFGPGGTVITAQTGLMEIYESNLQSIIESDSLSYSARLDLLREFNAAVLEDFELTEMQKKDILKKSNSELSKIEKEFRKQRLENFTAVKDIFVKIGNEISTIIGNVSKNQRAAAIANKIVSIADATINTAVGITKALRAGEIGKSIAIGLLGAAQVTRIATTPLPSAQTGTGPDGLEVRGPGRAGQDNIAVRANEGEMVNVTPRGEDAVETRETNIFIGEERLFSVVQRGIDNGDINITDQNIQVVPA